MKKKKRSLINLLMLCLQLRAPAKFKMGKRMTIDTHMAIQIFDGEHEYLILLGILQKITVYSCPARNQESEKI